MRVNIISRQIGTNKGLFKHIMNGGEMLLNWYNIYDNGGYPINSLLEKIPQIEIVSFNIHENTRSVSLVPNGISEHDNLLGFSDYEKISNMHKYVDNVDCDKYILLFDNILFQTDDKDLVRKYIDNYDKIFIDPEDENNLVTSYEIANRMEAEANIKAVETLQKMEKEIDSYKTDFTDYNSDWIDVSEDLEIFINDDGMIAMRFDQDESAATYTVTDLNKTIDVLKYFASRMN